MPVDLFTSLPYFPNSTPVIKDTSPFGGNPKNYRPPSYSTLKPSHKENLIVEMKIYSRQLSVLLKGFFGSCLSWQ